MQYSDYVSGYMQLEEVLKSLSIHPQSFEISKQNLFDSPITELTSSGVKYTRAPLGARGKSACSMVQTCQVNWTITIPKNTLATQLNKTFNEQNTPGKLNARTNFNGKEDALADWTTDMSQTEQGYFGKSAQGIESSEHLQFWIGFSTACGPFYQFQLMKDATALWRSAIYAREQAVIRGNSLSDLCTKNSVSVSPPESIIEGKRHCGVFIDIPLCEIDRQATIADLRTPFYYKIPFDITFSGVIDLNQLNPIFNSFPVLKRNYATLHIQLFIQDFLQDLKVVWLNKNDTVQNNHQAYHMIPPEKPDIVYLLSGDDAEDLSYKRYNVRIVNIQNAAVLDKIPQNSISQIESAKFDTLEIQNRKQSCQNTLSQQIYACMESATDDSFMRGYNSSNIGSRTNKQVIMQGNLTKGIIDTTNINPSQNQNDFKQFIGTRAYLDPTKAFITPMMQYLCDTFVRIIFDYSSMSQVLNIEVIGELAGGAIKSQ
ncbi:MAG: hypothetical protein EZS28_015923 [Streblomastix strix]|uniref:Uncharacterized protein n=1 Tax=Streblomastix strix TaxID=222440 RepID=A0A5J4W1M1_9EUKA|nr:MAG: hypothetical protein EZS28_015923 [Streblomastix strix]